MKLITWLGSFCFPVITIAKAKQSFFMRVSFLYLTIFFLSVHLLIASPGNAQNIETVRVTLGLKDASLMEAIQEIEKQTSFRFAYVEQNISAFSQLNLAKKSRKLSVTLSLLLQQTNLKYLVKNQTILLVRRNDQEPVSLQLEVNESLQEKILFPVKGTIKNENGEPLQGVSIFEKNSNNGTTSNSDGTFSIEVSDGNSILLFSAVGFASQEVPVKNQNTLLVTMSLSSGKMDEVVVVGYGTQSRRNVTGSVAKVDMKQLENLPNTNISQALRGWVPGVQFMDNGRPGQGGSILIRGRRSITASNDPLIILDGVFYNGSLADINPNDIESMEILKDASAAAIYGSRAANGVILINSKKGVSGKPLIRINTYGGLSEWSNSMKILSPERYIEKTLDARRQSGQTADPANIESYLTNTEAENYRRGISIDPWKEISQQGSIQSFDMSISGKWNKSNYFISAARVNEKGLIYNDNATRTSFRINLENEITNWLKIGINSQYTIRDLTGKEADTQQGYTLSPYGSLYFDSTGKTDPIPYPVDDQIQRSPLLYAMIDKDDDKKHNLFANLFAVIDIPFVKGLSYRINYSPNFRWEHYYTASPIYKRNGLNNLGSASKYNGEAFDWMLESIVSYSKRIQDHQFDVTLLYGRNQRKWESTRATGSNFFTDVLSWNNLNLAQVQQSFSNASQVDGISSMARLNYQFKSRYLLTVTARRDGTSVFGANHKYGLFPSAAFAWVLSDEPILEEVSFINFLKLRLSYGSVGNQAINPYQSLSQSANTQYVYGDNGATVNAVYNSTMANNDLRWETTVSKNAALDFELFNGRIGGTLEYYDMNTKDLLLNRSLPSPTGFSRVLSNLGSTRNNGIEVALNSVNIQSGKFKWNSNLMFSYNKNQILHLYGSDNNKDGIEDDDLGNNWFIGKPISINYDYVLEGVYQEGETMPAGTKPGFLKFKDLNKDGKIDAADRTVISQREPKYRWGINNTFKYGNLSLSVFVNAMTGWDQSFYLLDPVNNYPGRPVNMLDAGWWTPENKSNTRPSLAYTNPYGYAYYTSRDFIRIQDVSIAYEFSSDKMKQWKMNSLRVYVSGKNLKTFTDYAGQDPESGYNWAGYPTARSIIAGLNLSF
jgi:TonB-linked SusC/RagA family outer membrane protein